MELLALQEAAGNAVVARAVSTVAPAIPAGPAPSTVAAGADGAVANPVVVRLQQQLRADPQDSTGAVRRQLAALDPVTRQAVATELLPLLPPDLAEAISGGAASTVSEEGTRPAGAADPDADRERTKPKPSGRSETGSAAVPPAGRHDTPRPTGGRPASGAKKPSTVPKAGRAKDALAAKPKAAAGETGASQAPMPPGTTVEPVPELDLSTLAPDAPRLALFVEQLQSMVGARKAEINAAAQVRRTAVSVAANARRQAVQELVGSLIERLTAAHIDAAAQVRTTVGEQTGTIRQEQASQRAAAQEVAGVEAARVGTEGRAHATDIRQAARNKRTEAKALGTSEAQRARAEVAQQQTDARNRGQSQAGTYRDPDSDKAASQASAVRQVADKQAAEMGDVAPETATFAQEQAGKIGTDFDEQAARAAGKVEQVLPEGQQSIRGIATEFGNQIRDGAATAVDWLHGLSTGATGPLAQLRDTTLGKARELQTDLNSQIDVVERAALDQVASTEGQTLTALNDEASQAVARAAANRRRRPAPAAEAGPFDELVAGTLQAFEGLGGAVDEQLAAVATRGASAGEGIEGTARSGYNRAVAEVGTTSTSLVARASAGFESAVGATRTAAAESATALLGGIEETSTKTTSEFDSAYDKGRSEVTTGVDESLAVNTGALGKLGGNMNTAAAKAATEFDRPWWKKAALAIGKGLLMLGAAILATLVLAAVIFAVAVVLVKLGIIAGITFAAAFVIAAVVIGVGYFFYEVVNRAKAYVAEHGAPQGFWNTLGVSLGISLASLGSVFGITPVIEGFRGKRFFSDIPLSSQERYDMVIGGFLQLAFMFLGGKFLPRVLGGSRPPGGGRGGTVPGEGPRTGRVPEPEPPGNRRQPAEPHQPPEPARRTPYDPARRSDAELVQDQNPAPRPGETAAEAQARVDAATAEIALRRTMSTYEALGDQPRRIRMRDNDAAHAAEGAHTIDRHGPDVPLRRTDAPPGSRTVEGRIHGDPPWQQAENWSYRWRDEAMMNRTVNDYLRANWETIRSDLATNGQHARTVDTSQAVGEGFFNSGQMGTGPRTSVYHVTSYFTIVIRLIPGSPPRYYVHTTFPAGRGLGAN